mmetsp:Transcript_13475/g.31708  ORF Transcript_13475/g.31708 Transcript_13475/m.31708 type:complete len:147 (+) Transcript_13475:137-577(+)
MSNLFIFLCCNPNRWCLLHNSPLTLRFHLHWHSYGMLLPTCTYHILYHWIYVIGGRFFGIPLFPVAFLQLLWHLSLDDIHCFLSFDLSPDLVLLFLVFVLSPENRAAFIACVFMCIFMFAFVGIAVAVVIIDAVNIRILIATRKGS